MPKRRHNGETSSDGEGGCLYIVIKDGKDRYGIRRFDLPSSDADSGDHAPLIRFKSPSSRFFAATGTKIMSMHSPRIPRPGVPVFDVRTLSLLLGPQHVRSPHTHPMYLPVGDRLVALDDECSPEVLEPPSRTTSRWAWRELSKTPFKPHDVTCHAAHPDGRTIFVSVKTVGTYSVNTDTEHKLHEWRLHGEWMLPFAGRAHFDPSLHAWVGLSGDPDTLGHLCSCHVVPSTGPDSGRQFAPAWKLSKENLFRRQKLPVERHVGASLVYMGVRTVCLVQYYLSAVEDDDVSRSAEDMHARSGILRLATFSLSYDKDGDLRAEKHRPVRRYQLPPKASKNLVLDDNPVAFWI